MLKKGRGHWTKAIPPLAHGLMADINSALGQQILDIAKRERILDVQQHRRTDHFGRTVEIAEWIGHQTRLRIRAACRNFSLTMPNADIPASPRAKNLSGGPRRYAIICDCRPWFPLVS